MSKLGAKARGGAQDDAANFAGGNRIQTADEICRENGCRALQGKQNVWWAQINTEIEFRECNESCTL
jgi:hypothetical protein